MPTSCWIALQLELHLLAQLEVERAERLVEQQHARLVHERARERDALLLAARELPRLALRQARRGRRARASRARGPCQLRPSHALAPQAEGDVLEDRQVREERVALEDGVDVALVRRQADDVAGRRGRSRPSVGSSKPPIIRSVVVLPQPDGPSSAKNEPARDLERDPVDRDDVVEALRDVLEADVGGGRAARGRGFQLDARRAAPPP